MFGGNSNSALQRTRERSRPCHLSANYFYLSTTGIPSRLERAERSLTVLRELAAPQLEDDAEAGFIWLGGCDGDTRKRKHAACVHID